jgi:hypothetical protein
MAPMESPAISVGLVLYRYVAALHESGVGLPQYLAVLRWVDA